MSKRTAGPWVVSKHVDPPNLHGVAWPTWEVEADSLNDGQGGIICELPAPSRGYPEIDAQWDANALLISKAPDLLALLKRYVANAHEEGLYQEAKQLLKELGEDDE